MSNHLLKASVIVAFLMSQVSIVYGEAALIRQTGSQIRHKYGVDAVKVNSLTSEIVTDKRLASGRAVSLKKGIAAAVDGERMAPDLTFNVEVPTSGRYEMSTFAVTDEEGAVLMKQAKSKFESLFIKIQIDEGRPTRRVVYVPWDRPLQISGKFELSNKSQQVKIWLPRGVRLEYIEFKPYIPPKVPIEAERYHPELVPPATRPRIWVNQQTLPKVKSNLKHPENGPAWAKVKSAALEPYLKNFDRNAEMMYDDKLEQAAEAKAFYYLITGDKKSGREAIELMSGYLSHVEFGNILDITREIGRAIFTAAEVYDWCYDLLSADEKAIFCDNLLRLADDMEIGWPPFLQKVVSGHGNEAQLCRDLLAMSIAIYDENPLPYKYTSYAVLKELVPMRKFEYQSPRHNQGVSYGAYRFGWDMHAAWLFKGMTGKNVFDDNIKNVPDFWLYMRTPDGQMLRDGDNFGSGDIGTKPYYWGSPLTMLLSYAYSSNPIIKADFEKQGGLPGNPVLFLLLNDPALKAQPDRGTLSLTKYFGPVLGSMIARTGWNIGEGSSDVVAEIKGGGFHFGNHQHSDAGAVQLYYRGFQFGDLGTYKFYGTPYDMNFNKRSVAHSMMLTIDPDEKFLSYEANDGGTRLIQRNPKDSTEAKGVPLFNNGKVLSADFGPSTLKPLFSYFSVDLTGAYSPKLSEYNRDFCFLNLNRDDVPAAIILSDNITSEKADFKKYWQINAFNSPVLVGDDIVLKREKNGLTGKTHINMLLPKREDRDVSVLSGDEANGSFGFKYEAPIKNLPEANGYRILVSPAKPNKSDYFLTVFQVTAGEARPLPVRSFETEVSNVVILGDRVVSLSKSQKLIDRSFGLDINIQGKYQILLAGMQKGVWEVRDGDGKVVYKGVSKERNHTIFFEGKAGRYQVAPIANR